MTPMDARELAAIAAAFDPHADLARALLPHGLKEQDPAHDACHLLRVWRNAVAIAREEGGDLKILAAATILHDCVNIPKTSPERSQASRRSAEKARDLLAWQGWDTGEIEAACHAIAAHSFSARITPETLEARILQDADRLEALGAIGIARCLILSGRLDRPLYDPADPLARERPLDDRSWTLDHFPAQLLTLAGSMTTATGQRMAATRHARTKGFYEALVEEVTGRQNDP